MKFCAYLYTIRNNYAKGSYQGNMVLNHSTVLNHAMWEVLQITPTLHSRRKILLLHNVATVGLLTNENALG